ncbi:GTP-binding protein, putative [Theileria annulata]|uniref:GTP-binding protein, putative n=1 Tax=Theileria annulata TaxID=5874 RepID=Q4UCF8_THEAN|nr:GTP-binding protein, putative [Theileria annulata]CAI75493.1 GTP-binding protein, putative [Theileria annulata]|eukprot:XP_954969.1 GTP-binding protein, putative [Theileria annulata]
MLLYTHRFLSHIITINKKCSNFCFRFHSNIRNVAVVAHVDHGKTTLVDQFLKYTGGKLSHSRVMDSHELERERGITILSKVTRINWNDHILNIIDTPGHSDFGGEVERILNIVDCICLLVDVVEGPKPQTNFVLRKALENQSMRSLVVINKCDRECHKSQKEIENELFDLYLDCNANDEQLEFPILYVSAKDSIVSKSYPLSQSQIYDISHILKTIIDYSPEPKVSSLNDLTFQVSLVDIEEGSYLITGKVYSGTVSPGSMLYVRDYLGNKKGTTYVKDLFVFVNGKRVKMADPVLPGDIITIQCYKGITPQVNDTVSTSIDFESIPPVKVSDPVISVLISANSSPFSGKDGKFKTTSDIGKRLKREAMTNLSLQIQESEDKNSFLVKGRGELQIGILLENMRREGYEMTVSPLSAITFEHEGNIVEALQRVIAYVPSEYSTKVVDTISSRNMEITKYSEMDGSEKYTKLEFEGSTSQMMGLMPVLRDITRGRGEFNVTMIGYSRAESKIYNARTTGSLISCNTGTTTAFALDPVMSKGTLFVPEGAHVYQGMVIGESYTDKDLLLNVTRVKPVTGMRNKSHEQSIKIVTRPLNVEQALAFINSTEQLELTPKRISIRKKNLNQSC